MNTVELHLGLDYSEAFVQVCAMDSQEKIHLNRKCANDWRALAEAVSGVGVVKRAVIEACTGAADLAEELVMKAGWDVQLAHPLYVAKMKRSPDKSDYTDARLLADLSRVGYVPPAWLPPAEIRDLRQLVGYRQGLVDQRRAMKLRVGALLREQRVQVPQEHGRWSKPWVQFIRETKELSDHARWILGQTLDELEAQSRRIEASVERLRQATEHDAVVARLQEQKGVGEVTSWVLRAYVGDFHRFANGKQLSRYCGLSPCNASSGGRQADSGLVRAANRILRATIIQAAHRLIRTDEKRWGRLAVSMRARGKAACVTVAAVGNRWMRNVFHAMTKEAKAKAGSAQTASVETTSAKASSSEAGLVEAGSSLLSAAGDPCGGILCLRPEDPPQGSPAGLVGRRGKKKPEPAGGKRSKPGRSGQRIGKTISGEANPSVA